MMKKVGSEFYQEIREWMYRNARNVELCMWQYLFEGGTQQAVADALSHYQNEDGGFGRALEPDNWNPQSTPIATHHVLRIYRLLGMEIDEHPIFTGINRYLKSGKDKLEYGWRFNVAGNDLYPHAPWWNYSEIENKKEYFGVTAGLCSYILLNFDKQSAEYQNAVELTKQLLNAIQADIEYGDMGLMVLLELVEVMEVMEERGENAFAQYDREALKERLGIKITQSIEHDVDKWQYYGTRPSKYIDSPNSPYYEANKDIVNREIQYLIESRPKEDVWGITWTWFDNNEKYAKEFAITENWWKGYGVIEKMLLLRNFGIEF